MEAWRKQFYENELYHYGVKGMKWGKRKKRVYAYSRDGIRRLGFRTQNPNKTQYPNSVGVEFDTRKGRRSISFYNTGNKKYWRDGEKYTKEEKGAVSREYAEDGSVYTLNISKLSSDVVNTGKSILDRVLRRR